MSRCREWGCHTLRAVHASTRYMVTQTVEMIFVAFYRILDRSSCGTWIRDLYKILVWHQSWYSFLHCLDLLYALGKSPLNKYLDRNQHSYERTPPSYAVRLVTKTKRRIELSFLRLVLDVRFLSHRSIRISHSWLNQLFFDDSAPCQARLSISHRRIYHAFAEKL